MSDLITKNRERMAYSFANINLLGKCNVDCYFCLGKDIEKELAPFNQLNTHFSEWDNFDHFLSMCNFHNIKKIYLTGQTADGLQYRYLDEIIEYLQGYHNLLVGVRTNGYLARTKIEDIKSMKGGIGYSIHTLKEETNKKIMGVSKLPDWDTIIPASGKNVRASIVLNKYNVEEFYNIVEYLASFDNIRYIQVRRISTDTRLDLLEEDVKLYEDFYNKFKTKHNKVGDFYLAEQYILCNKEVNFWRTVETSCNSLNYFTDGTCSDEYFIVEGYLKNRKEVK